MLPKDDRFELLVSLLAYDCGRDRKVGVDPCHDSFIRQRKEET